MSINNTDETWTVEQLIEELKKYPPEYKVYSEGCDCIGNVVGIELFEVYKVDINSILLNRNN